MTCLLLALALAAPPAAPEAPVVVTSVFAGKKGTWDGPLGTKWEGLALTLVGSSEAVAGLKVAEWAAAVKKNHLLVSFPKPHAVKGPGKDGGQTFEVSAILIRVADTGVIQGLWMRCGEAYYALDRYNAALALLIEERYLPQPK